MNELMNFDFNSNQVRIFTIEGEPWFTAKDLANILEYTKTNKMLQLVDEEDKRQINPQKLDCAGLTQSFGAYTFKLSVVNESGLYACIFGSTKPEAKKFKKWVTLEVLPEIRKTGLYNPFLFRLSDDSTLVSFEGEDYWVTTTTISEMFDKEHRNVVRDFQQAQEDYSNALKFERIERQAQEDHSNALKFEGIKDEANELPKFKMVESSYVDAKGRTQRAFKVNRPLFNYVVLGYQGDKAKLYRMKFIKAFEDLERQVKVYLTQQLVFKDPKRQQVYILKNLMTEYIKIGVTNNIDRRRAQLETASGCDIEVLFLAPLADNSRSVEQELHEDFKEYRLRGEWFDVDPHEVILALRQKDLVIYPNLPALGGTK